MKKILHVIGSLDVGGAELMLKNVVLESASHSGCSHVVVSLTDIGPVGRSLLDGGITVLALNTGSLWSRVILLFRLHKIMKETRPEIVHTWLYHSDLFGGLAAKMYGCCKIIWCVRSDDITKGGSRFTIILRKISAYLSSWLPDKIVCVANRTCETHVALGYQANKMLVIHNGFDTERSDSFVNERQVLRAVLNITDDEVVIASVGRHSPVKDHKTLIAAAALLLARHNNLRFLLVGRGNDLGNLALINALRDLEILDRFILLGERNDVQSCLFASDIFCLHSITEGFPNALGEAMKAGLPCVATDVGDAAFILDEPQYVVPPSDPQKLADALERIILLGNADRSRLGARMRTRIADEFSIATMVRKYTDLYQAL
ncbi:MAG: glycosyltransferase [Pseudohongiella sp.]|nr:glycosyltransferase [Pseudohongiella sp.]